MPIWKDEYANNVSTYRIPLFNDDNIHYIKAHFGFFIVFMLYISISNVFTLCNRLSSVYKRCHSYWHNQPFQHRTELLHIITLHILYSEIWEFWEIKKGTMSTQILTIYSSVHKVQTTLLVLLLFI